MSLKKIVLFIFFISLFFSAVSSAENLPEYKIQANIDVAQKIITAHQEVTIANNSSESWKEIYFHVYPHRVFTKKEKAQLMEFASFFKTNAFPDGFQIPKFNIGKVTENGQTLSFQYEGSDQTVLKIILAAPLAPNQSTTINIDFTTTVPHAYGRFGSHNDVITLSRWYPILSVYKDKKWANYLFYPFHRPFFSDAAKYLVELTVAKKQVVIHSGVATREEVVDDSAKKIFIDSKSPIREFSLALSADYKFLEQKVETTTVKSYYLPGHKVQAAAALESAAGIMKEYSQKFGAYPYEVFNIAPVYLGYGGEQMSNLAFIDTRVYDLPKFLNRYFDFLIAHETGHQWFYNLVGTDEYTEMWLEEGVHSYFLGEYLEKKYGSNAQIIDFPRWAKKAKYILPELTFRNSRDYRYKFLARSGWDHPVAGELASFHEPSSIFAITYGKGSRILSMLKDLMGEEAFNKVFQKVFSEYQFKNLSIDDFRKICQQQTDKDLTSFFDQWLYTEKTFDIAIDNVKKNQFTILNKGGINMPVDVKVVYQNGESEIFTQEIKENKEVINKNQSSAIKKVVLDPEHKLLDIDRTNNYSPREIDLKLLPLYHPLYDIPVFLNEDAYNVLVGPEIANGGVGVKTSLQKPLDQILYAGSDYEFSEHILYSRLGYQLNNLFHSQTALGFEIANRADYDQGDEDLTSGKIYLRKELWPIAKFLFIINDNVSLYILRNRGLNATLISAGTENDENISYRKRDESIIGTAFHLDRSYPYPDPNHGFKVDTVLETSQHFLNATQFFNRACLDTSFYQPVTLNSKAALRLKYGWGGPDDKNLYELGGIDGLRGFDRKEIRGSNAFLQSLEYRFPIKQNLNLKFLDNIIGLESISGVAFFDAGQSWYQSFNNTRLRKDAGLGLRMSVNVGSFLEKMIVRVDAAKPINDDEDDMHFWFGVNHAF